MGLHTDAGRLPFFAMGSTPMPAGCPPTSPFLALNRYGSPHRCRRADELRRCSTLEEVNDGFEGENTKHVDIIPDDIPGSNDDMSDGINTNIDSIIKHFKF
eukprot:4297199-Amphidinium_carterae.1